MRALLVVLLAAAPASAFWFGPRTQSKWAAKPVTVDGQGDDWSLDPGDDHDGVQFGFANDAQFLYLMLSPHTRETKEQLSGVYQQDLMIWLDPKGKKARYAGLLVLAPAQLNETDRALEPVRVSTAAGEPAAAVAPIDTRGVLEARLPLSWLGTPTPETFTVGLEALTPRRPPASLPPRSARDPGWRPENRFEPVTLWVRVTIAKPPTAAPTKQ